MSNPELKILKFPKRKRLKETQHRLVEAASEIAETFDLQGFFIMTWDKDGEPAGFLHNSDKSRYTGLLIPKLAEEMARTLLNKGEAKEVFYETLSEYE